MATPTIPRNSTELVEMLADPKRGPEVMETPQALADFIDSYANKQQGDGTELQRQVDEAVQAGFANFLREQGADKISRPSLKAHTPDPYAMASKAEKAKGLYNRAAAGAAVDGLFDSSGEFFHAIWRGSSSRDTAETQAKLGQLKNFSSDIPADGGFLIPETLRSEMLKVALEQAIVRPRARVIPMETLRVPFPAIDSTSNVNSVYGGITTYWTEEGGKLQGSKPRFGRVVLDAKKLTAYTEIPNELLTDSLISLTAFVDEAFPEALAFAEDQAFLTGDGVGKPLGILNGNAAISVTRTGAGQIQLLDVINMYARMLPQSISRACWVASHDTWPQLAQMALTRGTDGIASPAMWMTGGQAIDAPPLTLMGLPVIRSEKVPALGNAGDLALVDMGFYLVGDRQAMQAKQSEDFKFDTDEVAFRVIERVDGRPWLQSAITPANGGSSLSPIVKLAA
ncbi:phage major capsid protein [Streptomyces sp. NPDC016845]|uniref:phage major capsid protein n=1 Tax=Streptomyces sp. NPDC016845 TaxID=3364972 RepID=UPI0037BD4ADE